jgi:hypothetical protein
MSAFATGERQGLQERSDEGPRARTVQNRHSWRDTACKPPHSGLSALRSCAFTGARAAAPAARQLRSAASVRVAGASW